jgi:tetratricopeptide (TPR) repeat protein
VRARKSKRRMLRAATLVAMATSFSLACSWQPSRPFDREAPAVNQAIAQLDGGDANAAANTLEEYLSTGECNEGNIGTPGEVRKKPNGTFDLGLALFRVGEAFGGRFGDEEADGGEPSSARGVQIDCALRIVRAIADDDETPLGLRARAHYLEGNLLFLGQRYQEAVKAYDKALGLAPGQVDAGDPVGRDAAWNRAIALRRIDDKKDAGPDSGNDGGGDGGNDGGGDSGKNDGGDGGNDKNDGGNDSGKDDKDSGNDASSGEPPPPQQPDGGQPPPPPPSTNADQDEKILDQLEKAPTVQQEAAKKSQRRQVRGMADK